MKRLFRLAAIALIPLALPVMQRAPLRAAPQGNAVKLVPNGRSAGGNPGQKGATYYSLEGQASRVTTQFLDGTKAVGERGLDGDVVTKLEAPDGNEINRLRVDRNDGVTDVVQYIVPSASPVQALVDPNVRATLDWSNRQSHVLYQDRVVTGAGLQWQDRVIRREGAPKEKGERDVVRYVETQWANGLSARTSTVHSKRGDLFNGHPVQGDVLVTKLMRDGVEVGLTNYLTYERIYAWRMPGLTEGTIATEHLQQRYGGWPFTPDMVWMNLQAIGLYHWKTIIAEKGFVARQQQQPAADKLLQFFAPRVSADEPGCDRLHWLDGSIFRACCDVHDFCYQKNGCDAFSWWMWWTSWRCDACNMNAVFCFAGAGGTGPFYRNP